MSPDQPQEKIKKALTDDFDPTAELWDRITEDIVEGGAPCLDTIAELVDQACHRDPKGGKKQDP